MLNELGSTPVKFPYVPDKPDKGGAAVTASQLKPAKPNEMFSKNRMDDAPPMEFESQSPLENRVSVNSDINSKDVNLDLTLQVTPSDYAENGVTFFSE